MKRTRTLTRRGLMLLAPLFCLLITFESAFSQQTITGRVTHADTGNPLNGVSIQVKGRVLGTSSSADGSFVLTINDTPPFVLNISSIGFASQEVTVTETSTPLSIQLRPQTFITDEVVVSASRMEESVLKSPVSIEKIGIMGIRNTAQPSFYDALQNLKGVEMNTQSLTFRSVNTRGFGANGNTRLVQLMDGMDNQAPGLNFAVGNVVGMSELDVESVELLPGAASALYGPNAINGLLLMNSKSPFTYQGVSAYVKTGIMSASNRTEQNTAFQDVAVRFAKSFNDKFAFKVNVAYLTGKDWQATDYRDQSFVNNNNTLGETNSDGRPLYDGVNWYGDVGTSVPIHALLYGNGMPGDGSNGTSGALGAIFTTPIPQIGGVTLPQFIAGADPMAQIGVARSILAAMAPSAYYQNAPGYAEHQLTDYPVNSLKLNASVHYRFSDKVEGILQANWGKGSAVYTAADRYNLQNFTMGQYKAELRGDNFFARAYTTRENSGDAHALGVMASLMSQRYLMEAIPAGLESGLPSFVQNAYSQYAGAFLQAYSGAMGQGMGHAEALSFAQGAASAHTTSNNSEWVGAILAPALAAADAKYGPGGTAFDATMADLKTRPIPAGANFLEKTSMYHAEAMYNFKNQIDPELVEVLVGGNYRVYDLNSEGTLFAMDQNGDEFDIHEYGAYIQAAKSFADIFKLTASMRYDKNENFAGQFSPRVSGVLTLADVHNFRASFQRGFRIPSTQNQYIDLNTPQRRLIGGLPLFRDKYDLETNQVYTYNPQNNTFSEFQFKEWEPERVETYEIGYKTIIDNRLSVDAFYYYNRFLTFEGNAELIQLKTPGGPISDLSDPTKINRYGMPMNASEVLENSGWGLGIDYLIGAGYAINANVTQNVLLNESDLRKKDPYFVSFFNSPEYRFNVGLVNSDLYQSGWGFAMTYRHQTDMVWHSTLAPSNALLSYETTIPAFSTFDAQISKKLPAVKSIIKIGGTNIGNKLYTTAWGNPSVGGLYYLSITFDELLN